MVRSSQKQLYKKKDGNLSAYGFKRNNLLELRPMAQPSEEALS